MYIEGEGEKMIHKMIMVGLFVFLVGCTNVEVIQGFENMEDNVESRTLPKVVLQEGMKDIKLNTLHIDTKIVGNIAQTTYEMAFYNPNDRILEGELKLPLLDGQSIVEYALEVDGKYRNSSVVEKTKAKKAYENTIRQNIDPGMVEKTLGNNYRLRLYPLPAKGFKNIKVTIEEVIPLKGANYQYVIPFVSSQKIHDFKLTMQIISSTPVIAKLYGFIKNKSLEIFNKGYRIAYEKKDMRLHKPIILAIKNRDDKKVFFQRHNRGGKNWFMVVVPKNKVHAYVNYIPKESIEIIWDTSLSANKRDITKEFAFLEAYFAKYSHTNYSVNLSSIDIAMHHHGVYTVTNGNWKNLKAKLHALKYTGAKDLSKLTLASKVKRVLFFSNGINSFNDRVKVGKKVPVVTISSSMGCDANNLKYIAKKSNGKYLDLLKFSTKEALEKFSMDDSCKIRKNPSSISDVYIKDASTNIIILGRIKGLYGTLNYSIGNEKYTLAIDAKNQNRLLSRVWASSKIESLSLQYKKNRTKIMALAKHYKIVTKDTSLLVLDRVEDYVRYEVVPPKSLQKEYYARLKKKKREQKSEKKRAIEASIALLKEQKIWYRKKFPEKKKRVKKNEDVESENGGDIAPVEPVAMPSPVLVSKVKKKKRSSDNAMQIKLKEWSSNASYLKALKGVAKRELFSHYLSLQKEYVSNPSFYVDMSDYFYKKGLNKEALLILSNLLEIDFEKSEFIRVFAFKLLEYKWYNKAIFFFNKVKELRPFELQSIRDLALAYERAGKYQKALDLHYEILTKGWNGRFGGVKIVTINELNHLVSKYKLNLSKIDRRLIARMPVDVRIVINWSTDNTDMDLWVVDPKGEKTYYGNRTSRIGGKISNDMTGGYGPEEFMIKRAIRGKYVIKVKYYASSQQKLTGPTVIRAEVYTKYAKKSEKRQEIVFRVEEEKEVIDLGEIVY